MPHESLRLTLLDLVQKAERIPVGHEPSEEHLVGQFLPLLLGEINPDVEYVDGIDSRVTVMTRRTLEALAAEMVRQDARWGDNKPQSMAGWLLLIEFQLNSAKFGYSKGERGKDSCLHNLVQAAALALRALNQYGVTGCPAATNDKREDDHARSG